MKRNFIDFIRNKGFYLAIGVCALAIVAAAGFMSLRSGQQDKQLAENAADFEDVPEETPESSPTVADHRTEDNTYDMDYTQGYNADEVQNILNEIQEQAAKEAAGEDDALAVNAADAVGEDAETRDTDDEAAQTMAGFDETHTMIWPVSGSILMDYSMDTTVYFETLEQYKCNPGILIATEANMPVNAAFEGTVASITNDAALGTVITVDMGNGYQTSYGQVKDVAVSEGDTVKKGQLLGNVALPTKYFGIEGSHLNFKMTKDGLPMDPKPFME